MPAPLEKEFARLEKKIDANRPIEGFGVTVTDGADGRVVQLSKNADAALLKDCVFLDSEEEEFFLTNVYTTGRREMIPPPT